MNDNTRQTNRPPIRIAPSLLAADFGHLADQVALVERGGADQLHVDVMDGHFVPNITLGPFIVKAISKVSELPLDCHLMITDPLKYIEPFAKARAWNITFHVEANDDPNAVIRRLRELGVRVGLCLSPDTPADLLFPYLTRVDMVLVMTVYPGFGGQEFMTEMLPKIEAIRAEAPPSLDIEIDGGVYTHTVEAPVKAGANVIVAGTAIFGDADPTGAVGALREVAEGG